MDAGAEHRRVQTVCLPRHLVRTRAVSASSDRSAAMKACSTLGPASRSAASTCAPRSALRPTNSTRSPRWASCNATARPIPSVLPVTRATRPLAAVSRTVIGSVVLPCVYASVAARRQRAVDATEQSDPGSARACR
jgi:hypothetical protein